MSFVPKPFARPRKLAVWLTAFIVISAMILAAVPAWAADSSGSTLQEPDRQLYEELAAGRKVLIDKSYTRPEQPTVYLTFDDGPSKMTPPILDILQQEGVPGTFFMLGNEAESHPDTVKRIVKEGHAIGNHTYDHVYSSLYGNFAEFWRQVRKTDDILNDIVGIHPQLLRAPGGTAGNFDAYYFYYLDQAGYTVYDWNIDSGDSRRVGVPAKEIVDTVKQGPFPHEVSVLMHDGTGHGETVKALPQIIKLFKEKGYAFAALSQQVKPISFHVTGKNKWARSVTTSSFAKLLAQARGVGAQRVEQAAAPPEPVYNDVPLQLRLRSRSFTVQPGGYELKQGNLHVPLRQLAEEMSARVRWDENKRTAAIHCGYRDIEYDLAGMELRTYAFGRLERTIPLADMKLVDGSIVVPLRQTLALFEHAVSGFSMEPADRYVASEPRKLAFFHMNPAGDV